MEYTSIISPRAYHPPNIKETLALVGLPGCPVFKSMSGLSRCFILFVCVRERKEANGKCCILYFVLSVRYVAHCTGFEF